MSFLIGSCYVEEKGGRSPFLFGLLLSKDIRGFRLHWFFSEGWRGGGSDFPLDFYYLFSFTKIRKKNRSFFITEKGTSFFVWISSIRRRWGKVFFFFFFFFFFLSFDSYNLKKRGLEFLLFWFRPRDRTLQTLYKNHEYKPFTLRNSLFFCWKVGR